MHKDTPFTSNSELEVDYISKSQKKRDSLALQDIGRKISSLKPAIIRKLPVSPHIHEALIAAKTMKMGAFKRQIQLIGKYLREEENLTPLYQNLKIYFK